MPNRRRATRVLACLLGIALVGPTGALAEDGDLLPRGETQPRRIARTEAPAVPADSLIVRYRDGTRSHERASIRLAGGLERLRSVPEADLEVVRPVARSLHAAATALRANPDVEMVALDAHRTLSVDPTGETYWDYQWGHHNVGQEIEGFLGLADADVDGLQALAAGSGSPSVVVAVIDDGVDFAHPELAGRQWVNPGESGPDGLGGDRATNALDDDLNGYIDDANGWDFCNDDNTVHDLDEDGHGTAVAGTIAAAVDGQGTAGIAPATTIMALKFIQDEPDPSDPQCGMDSMAIAAIAYAASFGVPIINASWGGDDVDPILEQAIETSGALFVAAAGNAGRNIDALPTYPASFDSPNILTVAATHNQGFLSEFSNHGTVAVDLAAPGEDIVFPCPATSLFAADTCIGDGTSFAAPYVAGIAALAGAADPALLASPLLLRARVLATAVPRASTTGRTATGRVANAHAVVDTSPPLAGAAPSALPIVVGQLGIGNVRLRLTWPAGTDDGDELSYRIERRLGAGAWGTVATGLTTRQADVTIGTSGLNEFRILSTDAGGNAAAGWSPSLTFTPALYQETTSLAKPTGTWRTGTSSSASAGRTRYTTASGASVTFTFTGRAVAFVAPRGPTRSSFKVYVDGKFIKSVSLHNATSQSRQVLYTTGWLAGGKHTLKLVNTRVGGRSRGEIDGFVVLR